MENIYIIYLIDAGKKTDGMLRREYEAAKLNPASRWNKKSFDEFINFKKSWGEYTYFCDIVENAYFTSEEEACKAVIANTADINEAGAYPYAAVVPVAVDTMYGAAYTERSDIRVFEFNKEAEQYQEMTKHDALANFIARSVTNQFTEGDSEL